MPIYLPPISRRRFLARAIAAGAGVVLGQGALASGKRVNANSWALLSDVHLDADRRAVVSGVNMARNFEVVAEELLGLAERPAGVFINGDCAHETGEAGDYAVLVDLLGPVRQGQMPVHLTLGNHDQRERFWEAFREEKEAKHPVADRQTGLVRGAEVNWFLLDSLEVTAASPGLLGAEQLSWLGKALDANADRPALVMVHHNPGIDGHIGLRDSLKLFEVIRPRKQVKAYIFGHTHVWRTEQDNTGLHLINLPPVGYVFKEGNPSGWVQATLEPKGMLLELRCVDRSHKAHGQKVRLTWRA